MGSRFDNVMNVIAAIFIGSFAAGVIWHRIMEILAHLGV